MPLKLLQKVTVPPGGYRYFQKETKTTIRSPSFDDLLADVRKHRQANGITTNGDLASEIEDQLCQVLPAGECKQDTGEAYHGAPGGGISFEQVKRGTATLIDWFL